MTAISESSETHMPLVTASHLKKWFQVRRGLFSRTLGFVRAVDGISFSIARGEVLGLVGESGCGKSTLGRLLLHLQTPTEGSVHFAGKDVTRIHRREIKFFRRSAQLVFQDPYSSLNPRLTVGSALSEVLLVHNIVAKHDVNDKVADLLSMVGLNDFHARRYPHEFSSGQRQRIGIARALATGPSFLVCDEPVSALDVSIQAQILNLLSDLRSQLHLTYLFISHDLTVVQHVSDRIAIMYLGRLVEIGSTEEIINNPLHPYTQVLLASIPVADPAVSLNSPELMRELPNPLQLPSGCIFHTRCPKATEECRRVVPELRTYSGDHQVSCLLFDVSWPEGSNRPDSATSMNEDAS